jgi:uncharacterized protein (TIRG00374 family)
MGGAWRRERVRIIRGLLLQFAVSAAFLAVLLWRVDPARLGRDLSRAEWRWVLPAVPLFAASAMMHGVRWWLIARRAGLVRLRDGVPALLVTAGANLVLPLNMGLAVLVQILHRRQGMERAAVLGTLGADAAVDIVVLVPLVLAVTPILPIFPQATDGIAAAGAAAGLIVLLVLFRHRIAGLVQPALRSLPLPRRFQDWLGRSVATGLAGFTALGSPRTVLLAVLVTLCDWTLAAMGHMLVGRAFHLHVRPTVYWVVEVAVNLSSVMPLTQGNVGPYEVVVRELLVTAGVRGNRAAAFAIGAHAVILATTVLVSIVAALALRLRWRDLFSLRPAPRAPSAGRSGAEAGDSRPGDSPSFTHD